MTRDRVTLACLRVEQAAVAARARKYAAHGLGARVPGLGYHSEFGAPTHIRMCAIGDSGSPRAVLRFRRRLHTHRILCPIRMAAMTFALT